MFATADTIAATAAMTSSTPANAVPTIGMNATTMARIPAIVEIMSAISAIAATSFEPQLSHQPSFRSSEDVISSIRSTACSAARFRSDTADSMAPWALLIVARACSASPPAWSAFCWYSCFSVSSFAESASSCQRSFDPDADCAASCASRARSNAAKVSPCTRSNADAYPTNASPAATYRECALRISPMVSSLALINESTACEIVPSTSRRLIADAALSIDRATS